MISRSYLHLDQCYTGGAFAAPHGQDRRDLVDPATEEVVASIAMADATDVDRAVQAAKLAFRTFGFSSIAERLALPEHILGRPPDPESVQRPRSGTIDAVGRRPHQHGRLRLPVGSVGDSYDNALAETIKGLYKAEAIHRRGPWRSFEAVEFATFEWAEPPRGPAREAERGGRRRAIASTPAVCSRRSATFHPRRPRPPDTHTLRPCRSPRRT